MSDRHFDEETLRFKTNSKIVKVHLKLSDLVKFRLTSNVNFDRKYCEARSFDDEFRDKSFDLIKFRLALSVKFDRKYYKSESRDLNSRMFSQDERKKRSNENKEKLVIFRERLIILCLV